MSSAAGRTESSVVSAPELPPPDVIFGSTQAMQAVRMKLLQAAETNIPVLIRGASGTGKEIIARLVHANSPWRHGPFVKVNCPAIPGSLVESELFGYERGAFTGAYNKKAGRFESAHLGTLFLDEIGDLDASLQAKLLQVLQDGKFCRIGGSPTIALTCVSFLLRTITSRTIWAAGYFARTFSTGWMASP